ncbi:eukaryotic translation initiation factor 3 subunit K [Poecile atricapillus]|uniref:eukaryotic translation initiation factor 3 subunit K n=1 Tax=Poecile atricapillus TaxID=48891 RepID=UPI00273A4BAE|nr:eukaryotic translation initiation factor 3 subunit K [Poecile atricapillus]
MGWNLGIPGRICGILGRYQRILGVFWGFWAVLGGSVTPWGSSPVICHVVGITYQHIDRWLLAEMLGDLSESQLRVWMSKYGWTEPEPGRILISNQEENIKPKNIVEKIDFDSVSSIMASSL